jgi:hypothetical protein
MNDNHDYEVLIQELKRGGWIMAIFGALGAFTSLVLRNEKYTFFIWFRKIAAGAVVGVITSLSLYSVDIEPIYKSVLCSIAGSIAPELFDWVRTKALEKLK